MQANFLGGKGDYNSLPAIKAARSPTRQLYPHSLSYQDQTLAILVQV